MVDCATAGEETRLGHGCKIVFLGNLASKDGSHVLVPVFSKVYLEDKGGDFLANSKTVFFPQRRAAHAPRIPMATRIMLHKWNYEERDHLK